MHFPGTVPADVKAGPLPCRTNPSTDLPSGVGVESIWDIVGTISEDLCSKHFFGPSQDEVQGGRSLLLSTTATSVHEGFRGRPGRVRGSGLFLPTESGWCVLFP